MLLKLSQDQFSILQSKLERSGIAMNQRQWSTHAENRTFYSILGSMGMMDTRSVGKRVADPNYEELGFDRIAGPPDAADIERYAQVTNGAELTDEGLIAQGLLFDSDLITDRYAIATFNLLTDLFNKYIGRGNDFNHSFDARQARSRIIDTHMGSDPGTALHPDTPIEAMRKLSPSDPNIGTYTAVFATLAFPKMANENGGAFGADSTINSVNSGLIHDISIAFQEAQKTTYCSICLEPMGKFWFWSYCDEHGFPGGRTDSGKAVVAIMDHASDVFTFGLVSDGAVPRAGIVLDPFIQNQAADTTDDVEASIDDEVEFWIEAIDEALSAEGIFINPETDMYNEDFGRAAWNDAAFAVVEKGATKEDGKSKPDSYRHLPHHTGTATDGNSDSTVKLNLLRNALARMNQIKAHKGDSTSRIRSKAKAHLTSHARRLLPNTKYEPASFVCTISNKGTDPQIISVTY